VKVMQTLKNQQGSVIELVMLLCSQEWQVGSIKSSINTMNPMSSDIAAKARRPSIH